MSEVTRTSKLVEEVMSWLPSSEFLMAVGMQINNIPDKASRYVVNREPSVLQGYLRSCFAKERDIEPVKRVEWIKKETGW